MLPQLSNREHVDGGAQSHHYGKAPHYVYLSRLGQVLSTGSADKERQQT